MSRGLYNTVTELPVLIPCDPSQQDGVLALPGGEVPVRIFRTEELDRRSKRGRELSRSVSPTHWERISAGLLFKQAIEKKDKQQIDQALQTIIQGKTRRPWTRDAVVAAFRLWRRAEAFGGPNPQYLANLVQDPQHLQKHLEATVLPLRQELGRVVSDWLSEARLVLWWSGKRYLPALFCQELKDAAAVRALLGIVSGNALVVCPRCGTPFVQKRSDQSYCSIRCREAHRVARWRASEKEKGIRGRKKYGTRKKR